MENIKNLIKLGFYSKKYKKILQNIRFLQEIRQHAKKTMGARKAPILQSPRQRTEKIHKQKTVQHAKQQIIKNGIPKLR